MLLKECKLLNSDETAQTQSSIIQHDHSLFLADIDQTMALPTLKAQLKKQINDLIHLSDGVKNSYGLETVWLVQQKKTIRDLANRFSNELDQFSRENQTTISTLDLLQEIMKGKKYDTQIHYDSFKTFDGTSRSTEEISYFRNHCLIPELKTFFDSTESTDEEKKSIEALIIFAIFLQATWDFYKLLEKLHLNSNIPQDSNEPNEPSERAEKTCQIALRYLELLDNLAYKCNPTIYKLLAALNYTVLWLTIFSFIVVPITVTLMLLLCPPSLPVILSLTVLLIFLFGSTLREAVIEPIFLGEVTDEGVMEHRIDARWGTRWDHRLPNYAVDTSPLPWLDKNPTQIGLFPTLLGRPAVRAGFSFNVMNRLGFFPFKETANASIETVERILTNTNGKNFVHLPCHANAHTNVTTPDALLECLLTEKVRSTY